MTTPHSILLEAEALINGPKRDAYGSAAESFPAIAQIWSVVLNRPVTPVQVALCMAGLKLYRQSYRHSRDNCVDLAAYAELANELETPVHPACAP